MSNSNGKKFIAILLFGSVITFFSHEILKDFWKTGINSDNTNVTTLGSLITIALVPIATSIFYYKLTNPSHRKFYQLLYGFFTTILFIWLSGYLHHKNWFDSVGKTIPPENETIDVIGFTQGLGYFIAAVSFLVACLAFKRNHRTVA